MKLQFDPDDIRPIVQAVVVEVLEQVESDHARLNSRMAYPESDAATLLGIATHTLRDCRRRGEIQGSRVGKRIVYSRDELKRFLQQNRV